MKIKKRYFLLIILVLSFTIGFSNKKNSYAENNSSKIQFILHKSTSQEEKNEIQQKLDDISFEVYDVTLYVEKQNNKEKTMSRVMNMPKEQIQKEILSEAKFIREIRADEFAGETGVAELSLSNTFDGQSILFIEKGNRKIKYYQTMLVILPVENPVKANEYLSTIHLYPKKVNDEKEKLKEKDPPTLKKNHKNLPKTGEEKSVFVFLGFLLMSSSFYFKMKKQSN
ncbi:MULTISPECIES: LPXTG cell wall anchor domain-containing protein [Vagococcus]|uniref:Gram-positive cocci surface proteins LPxTG domain-containing protein n=1 Tax=Vagococcus fluvialis bH819 TaxID=1255619 RepID=A0A1X6WPG8_9ENTE|nr:MULTISPECIES: LPXTG cell wall anchor domain-containing protein [Vagococcus]SLM86185.1 hypothetical protein FM121_08855 [Vagococcus fluvialis bH819]HCM89723.1 LPXTG cell wall anchor domain-containing protein [Vagococcus sp.]